MKKSKLIVVMTLVMVLVLTMGLVACEKGERPVAPTITVDPTEMTITVGQEVDLMAGVTVTGGANPVVSVKDNGGFDKDTIGSYTITYKATNDDVEEEVTATRKIIVEAAPITLQIIVNPTEIEIHAEDEIDLLFGVTVEGGEANVIVSDDDGFDNGTEGVYTITYKAIDANGNEVTATRTITVLKALSPYALEVTANKLGEAKWPGKIIEFKNALYTDLTLDTTIETPQSGIFHNASDADITLNVAGSYGVSAIITANGVVIEGRDGANGKLVNADNPSRTASTAKTIEIDGEAKSVPTVFAQKMVIPAGGYAIVVQNGYAGEGVDKDGRNFLNYNVIGDVGNVVRLYVVDSGETLTPYVNQKPVVSGNTKILVALGDASFDLETAAIAGVSATDDNGTFTPDDDVKIETVTLKADGGFDVNTEGVYDVTLEVSDGELSTTVIRQIEVKEEGIATVTVGSASLKIAEEKIAIDKQLSSIGDYAFIIYTSNFEGTVGYANGYGIAYVTDAYGKLVRIYDGANAKYYDAENVGGIKDAEKCTATGYITEAMASQQDGEIVIIAPNATANNVAGGSRKFFGDNKRIGDMITVTGLKLKSAELSISINGKTLTAGEGKWLVNDGTVTTSNASKYKVLVYDKSFTGTFTTNGYGGAFVLDAYGRLVKVYDGGNLGFYTMAGKAASAHFTTANFATVAFSELQDGEVLFICPNDGANGADSSRTFCFGLRTDGSIGKIATVNNVDFLSATKVLTVGDKTLSVEGDKWLYNVTVTAANAPKYGMLIYDKNHTGEVTTNGYGAAIVIDASGKLVKIYDGANGGFYTEAGKSTSPLTFTTSNYSTIAFSELQDGETLIVCPHDGASNPTRGFLLGLRGVNGAKAYCGETATLTGFTFTA